MGLLQRSHITIVIVTAQTTNTPACKHPLRPRVYGGIRRSLFFIPLFW